MLSKMLTKGAFLLQRTTPVAVFPQRLFRSDFKNPYKHDPTQLTDGERVSQESLPVWDRVFDFKKYMEHEGPLKVRLNKLLRLTAFNWYCFLGC